MGNPQQSCSSLIQPHIGYACNYWYPLVSQKTSKKIQITQNKCINFCLKLRSRHYTGAKEFKEIIWLPAKEKAEQSLAKKIIKYWKGTLPFYINELLLPFQHFILGGFYLE